MIFMCWKDLAYVVKEPEPWSLMLLVVLLCPNNMQSVSKGWICLDLLLLPIRQKETLVSLMKVAAHRRYPRLP